MLTKSTYYNVQMFLTLSLIGNKTMHSYIIYVTHRFKIETVEYWYIYL